VGFSVGGWLGGATCDVSRRECSRLPVIYLDDIIKM